jgi:lipopolysaccharide/colanic/teichoic acid biosynthesis glycosyltransferase
MTVFDRGLKRVFDIVFSLVGIVLTFWIMFISFIIASIDTKSFGLFIQKRVGKDAKLFFVFKIKTMSSVEEIETTVTIENDSRITKSGKIFRNTKIDELPQLFNVFFGSMSFVGPRPDVEGYADKLEGKDRLILSIRPGITGPASLKYRNEEEVLARESNPKVYNDEIIWVDKVAINLDYIKEWSFKKDIFYIIKTVIG